MSGLRFAADTSLQEFDVETTGQDFLSETYGISRGTSDNSNHFGSTSRSGFRDPALVHIRMLLERQFEAACETLASQQKQTLKALQEYCMEAFNNPSSQKVGVGNAYNAWAEPPVTLPGSPMIAQSPQKPTQRPFTPVGNAPEMPDPHNNEWRHSRPVMNGHMLTVPMDHQDSRGRITQADTESDDFDKMIHQKMIANADDPWDFYQLKQKRKKTSIVQEVVMENMAKDRENGVVQPPIGSLEGRPKAVFADAAAMKEKVKENIMKPEYNVSQFYKTNGIAQCIARSNLFDNLTLFVIFLNALWIWIDTDYNDSATLMDAHPGFQIGENLFCVYFTVELWIRFSAFKVKRDGLRDAWFVFDTCLVFMMVMETWLLNVGLWIFGVRSGAGMGNASILRLVRLLRLTRMARMARLMRAIPELMILVKGISVAARSVLFTLVLLFVILYVFAIAFRQLCAESDLEETHFKTVPEAMNTLLLKGVLPDQGALVTELGDVSYAYGFCVILFILLSSLTVMNMLVGVLCEVVSVVSSVEKEQMMVNFVKSKLLSLIQESGIDQDDNLRISRDEFEALLLLPEGARVIQEVGVDVVGLVDFADHIFKGDEELSFADVMELVLSLRGTNTATVRDVVDLRKFLTNLQTESNDHVIKRMSEKVESILDEQLTRKLLMHSAVVDKQLERKLNHHSAVAGKAVAKSILDNLTYDVESSVV